MFDFIKNPISEINTWVIGNWKMNGRLFQNEKYLEQLLPKIKNPVQNKSLFYGLAVPNPYLFQFSNRLIDSDLHLGVQDISSEDMDGAFTGDTSAKMCNEFDCSFAIIGHSERRAKYNEVEDCLVQKAKVSIKNNIIPIICVGETLKERNNGNAKDTIKKQVNCFTHSLNKEELLKCVFAYEPLWAIGTGQNAIPEDAELMHQVVRHECLQVLGLELLQSIKILYGGSVKAENAEQYFNQSGVDGALIGGASLDAAEFCEIIEKASNISLNN